jgi:hypothetical protein
MRKALGTVAALAAVVALALPASAKDMGGKFGVGVDQTLGGVTGLELKYFIGDFAVSVQPGFDIYSNKATDKTAFGLNIAIGGVYYFARSDQANLGFGAKVDMGYRNKEAGDTFQANIELPLVIEYFFTDHFAIHVATGLLFAIIPEKGAALNPPTSSGNTAKPVVSSTEGFGFSFGAGSLSTSAGATFYF